MFKQFLFGSAKGDASVAALAAEKAAREKARSDMAKSARNTAITRERDRRNKELNKNQQVETTLAKQKAREFSLKQKSLGKISAGQAKTQQRNLSSQWKTVGSKSILKGKTDNEIRAMLPINGKLSLADEKTLERITFEDYQRQRQSELSSDTIDQFKDATAQTQQRATRVSERLKQKREATQIAAESKRIAETQRIAMEETQRIAAESQKKANLAQQNASKAASIAKITSKQQQTAARSGLVLDKFKEKASEAQLKAEIAAKEAQKTAAEAQQAIIKAEKLSVFNQNKLKRKRPTLSKRLKQVIRDIKTLISI